MEQLAVCPWDRAEQGLRQEPGAAGTPLQVSASPRALVRAVGGRRAMASFTSPGPGVLGPGGAGLLPPP